MASSHYVNNPDFLQALKDYKEKVKAAEASGAERPQVSNYIGECILKIANHLSYKANFINYSYRDEMISDGIENCLRYVDNFDPEKSSNPFAYFTQIIYFAFLRRIAREKKQSVIKGKMIRDMPFESFELQDQDEDGHFTNSYIDFMQSNGAFDDFIERKKDKKAKAKTSLEELLDSDEIQAE
jgi:DNA-directed RNA polymerase specialized sigma24 family protein